MSHFCGVEHCKIDANGRVKLPPEFLREFLLREPSGSGFLRCLPEGALALYPQTQYEKMLALLQAEEANPLKSLAKRRELRYEGAWSCFCRISPQGRVTLPENFRKFALLVTGENCIVAGSSAGIEFWNRASWQKELEAMQEFYNDSGRNERMGEKG